MGETLFMSLSSMPLLQFLSYFFLLALLSLSIPFLFSGFPSGRRLPPAPKLRLPILGHLHLLSPVLHRSFHRLSLRYGPLFSLQLGSIPCIIVSSPYYAKQFLHANDLSFSNHLLTIAIKRLTYDTSLAFAPYGPYWKFIKRVTLTELLGGRAIANFQPLRSQECHELLRLLSEKAAAHETVNLTDELLKLTNNVISRMMFGEVEDARNVVRDVTKINGEFNFSDFVWIVKKLDFQGFEKRIEDIFQRFDKLVESIIIKRERIRENRKLENGKGGKGESEMRDFLDILLDYSEDESSEIKIDKVHIKGLTLDFFAAGTDTRAITTEWALVELLKNPKVMRKAQEEIDRVVGQTRLVQESDLPNLPFMQAIIKETFRLHPPVPFISRRSLAECKVENYVIPENTLLFVNLWAMGRDPNNWESPMDFRPERFLQDSMGLADLKGMDFQYLPFGAGKRICPGTTFAMLELPSLLAAIIQCFDFQFVGPKGETLMADYVLADMNERPGLTAPRAHDFVCVPVARPNCGPVLKSIGPNAELL